MKATTGRQMLRTIFARNGVHKDPYHGQRTGIL